MLALTASLVFGVSNFLAGTESRRRSVWSVTVVSQPAALAVAAVMLALSQTPLGEPGRILVAFLGGLAGGCAVIFYYLALASGTMTVVAPIVAACAVAPVLAGIASGERASALQYAGMALALGGIVLSSRAEAKGGGRVGLRSVLLAVAAAAGFGAMMIGLSVGADYDVYWSLFASRVGATAVILGYTVVRRPRLDVSLRSLPVLAAVGVLAVAAHGLYTAATTLGYLSIVAVLASLDPVVIAVLAHVLLHERLTRLQSTAATIVLAGVVLLAAG